MANTNTVVGLIASALIGCSAGGSEMDLSASALNAALPSTGGKSGGSGGGNPSGGADVDAAPNGGAASGGATADGGATSDGGQSECKVETHEANITVAGPIPVMTCVPGINPNQMPDCLAATLCPDGKLVMCGTYTNPKTKQKCNVTIDAGVSVVCIAYDNAGHAVPFTNTCNKPPPPKGTPLPIAPET